MDLGKMFENIIVNNDAIPIIVRHQGSTTRQQRSRCLVFNGHNMKTLRLGESPSNNSEDRIKQILKKEKG
jgi:hypothetical protein